MRTIKVEYVTQVPASTTDEQIMEHLRYALDERGDISEDNPLAGRGAEPHIETITFTDVTNADEAATCA